MSREEWERGTIKLPTASAAAVKKTVRDGHNAQRDAAKSAAKDFWQNHAKRTKSPKKYREALDSYMEKVHAEHAPRQWGYGTPKHPAFEADDLHYTLSQLSDSPRQVQDSDLDRVFGPRATNRTTDFKCGDEARIHFDGNSVTWSAAGNHAIDRARGHPTARALFGALNRVNWTRGSGGKIVGNDENNQSESDWEGGGGNYLTAGYGPLGDETYGMGDNARTRRAAAVQTARGGLGSNQYVRR